MPAETDRHVAVTAHDNRSSRYERLGAMPRRPESRRISLQRADECGENSATSRQDDVDSTQHASRRNRPPVVALNVYSNAALSNYAAIIDKYAARLAGKRIWVTETGSGNPDNHIAWVQQFYPRLVNTLHPEMICWYAMWTGDVAEGDNGFGLLDQADSGQAVERSLFRALAGEP